MSHRPEKTCCSSSNADARAGKQRYLCNDCKRRSRDNPSSKAYTDERREEILRAYEERSSLRGLTRTFGVSRNSVTSWIKKGSTTATAEYDARAT